MALAAVFRGTSREEVRTPLLVAAIEGWLSFSEAVVLRWLRDRRLRREDVHELLRRVLREALTLDRPVRSVARLHADR